MSEENSASRKWFYIDQAGETQGPMSLEEVAKCNEGIPDYYVFAEGLKDWVQASELPRLPAKFNSPPAEGQRFESAAGPSFDLADEEQLRWLTALGAEPGDGLTRRQASEWIRQFEGSGVQPTPKNLAAFQTWKDGVNLARPQKRALKKEILPLKNRSDGSWLSVWKSLTASLRRRPLN
ncbi:MAG: GYF domain-containing protein [Terriglobia bacterium]